MMTFPNYDYSLCMERGCKKKNNCVRYQTYIKAVRENKRLEWLSFVDPQEPIDKCGLYVEAKKD